jgi:excisionase family DNA binding protein
MSQASTGLGKEQVRVLPDERKTYSVEEAGRQLGICRNTAYLMARNGSLPTLRMGKRILVPAAALNRLLAGQAA